MHFNNRSYMIPSIRCRIRNRCNFMDPMNTKKKPVTNVPDHQKLVQKGSCCIGRQVMVTEKGRQFTVLPCTSSVVFPDILGVQRNWLYRDWRQGSTVCITRNFAHACWLLTRFQRPVWRVIKIYRRGFLLSYHPIFYNARFHKNANIALQQNLL